MSQRDRILLGAIATLAVFAGAWLLLVKPQRHESRDLQAQISAKHTELAGAASRAAEYRAARTSLRKHPEVFEQSAKALPNRVAMPELLRALTRTAKGIDVKMTDLSTAASDASSSTTPGIGSVGLSLTFSGDFLALQRYFSRLQHFVRVSKEKVAAKGRLLAIDSVQLAPGQEGSDLNATVKATAFILQPGALTASATATPGATGGSTTATPPATPSATTSTPTPSGGSK